MNRFHVWLHVRDSQTKPTSRERSRRHSANLPGDIDEPLAMEPGIEDRSIDQAFASVE